MNAVDVGEVLAALDALGVRVSLDGGWGIDSLIGEQTREHADLDLAADVDDLSRIEAALAERGYRHDPTDMPGLPARLVLRDDRGRQVDVHPLIFDDEGNGWQRLSESKHAWGLYPADHLWAAGTIGGRRVECLTPELQLRFHLGYEWTSKDEHDVRLLTGRLRAGPTPPQLVQP